MKKRLLNGLLALSLAAAIVLGSGVIPTEPPEEDNGGGQSSTQCDDDTDKKTGG